MEDKADKGYSRQLELEEKFNRYWNQALKTNGENYLKRLTTNDLVDMKKAISNINNLITLRVTLGFIDEICRLGIVNNEQAERIKREVNEQHPNTNGFDVQDRDCRIIAEIKCNIPVGEKSFGAAQKNALKKDLQGLRNGKTKGDIDNVDDYYKFMVIQDVPKARIAMKELYGNDCIELTDKHIDTNHIYIVYISL
ncbi:MAG: hypothetical protein K5633_06120 [Paludibacteraceae bacterium]|nr:hypothetical protein [Paludibacteraceae bacterium]